MLKPMTDKPYHPARLYQRKNGGYFIEFFAWHKQKDELQRVRRTYDLNKKHMTEAKRQRRAQALINQINIELENGYVIDDKDKATARKETFTVSVAFQNAYNQVTQLRGLKPSTIKNYNTHHNVFQEYLKLNRWAGINVNKFTEDHFQQFFDWLKGEREIANKTYNGYLGTITTLKNEIRRRHRHIWKVDPLERFDKLPVKAMMHAAYSNGQMARIKRYLTDKKEFLFISYIQFAYYTLARTKEIYNIKAGHIDLDLNRILIVGETAKGDENYCGIPPQLRQVIIENKINELPAHYFVFGANGVPNPAKHIGDNYFYRRNKRMLKALQLTEKRYTLYSYKHTGSISLYVATKDIKLLQRQLRHKQVSQTEDYLRDLGFHAGYSGLNDWEGAI